MFSKGLKLNITLESVFNDIIIGINNRLENFMKKEEKYRLGNTLMRSWLKHDHLRLGQLIVNAIGEKDLFYIEDVDLVELIKEYINKHTPVP